jgi:hypothetical protein
MTRGTRAHAQPPGWRASATIIVVAVLAVAAGTAIALVLNSPPATGSASPTPSPSRTILPFGTLEPTETPDPTALPSDSPEVSPTETPSDPGPTPAVHAPGDLLPPYSVARVTGDGLRLRVEPSTDGELVATLAAGELLGVAWGEYADPQSPVTADGFTWYEVIRLADLRQPPAGSYFELIEQGEPTGWVAAAGGGSRFLELVPGRCVAGDDPDLEVLDAWTPWERLSCLGDRTVTFEGVYGCGGCGGIAPGVWEPAWLASPLNFDFVSVDPIERIGPMSLRFPPAGPQRPEAGAIIRVTGHFDDPVAAGCQRAPGDPPEPQDARMAKLYCRMGFVVESYEVIGTFDDFPTS